MIAKPEIHKEFNTISNKQVSLLSDLRDNEMAELICQQLQNSVLIINTHITDSANSFITTEFSDIETINYKHQIKIHLNDYVNEDTEEALAFNLFIVTSDDVLANNIEFNTSSHYLILAKSEHENALSKFKLSKHSINISYSKDIIESKSLSSILEIPAILKLIYTHKEAHIHKLTKVAYKILRRRSNILSGNVILNKGKEILLLGNNVKKIQLESNKIKQTFTKEIRAELTEIDNKLEEYFSDSTPEIQEQIDKLNQYEGHNEVVSGKVVTYSFPDGYLDTVKEESKESVSKLFLQMKTILQETTNRIEEKIKKLQSNELKVNFGEFDLENENFDKGVDRDVELFKPEIRKSGYSGMSAIFGAIRTPIYALFPLMMIARFIPSSDVGAIDHSIKTYDNQSVVAVSKIPETYGKSVTKFIDAVDDAISKGDLVNKRTGKDMFKFSVDNRGKKHVEYSTLKSGEKTPYILLPVYSDREDAAKVLMENILTIQLRFNIVAEVKKIPKILGPFDRFFGPIVLSLLFYFIYRKKTTMKETNAASRKSECSELTKNIINGFNSFLKSSESNCNLYIKNYFRQYSEEKTKIIDDYYLELINQEEVQRIKDIKLFKSREKLFQTELKHITDTHRKLFEVGKEYSSAIQNISK